MTTYVPKLYRPVIAVRLKEDLLIPKGDWLTLDADNYEEINQFTDTQFRSLYGVTQPVNKKPAKEKVRQIVPTIRYIPVEKSNGDYCRTNAQILSSKPGRFFYYIRRIEHPVSLRYIVSTATVESDKVRDTASATVSLLKKAGLIDARLASEKDTSGKANYLYSVNDFGCTEFDKLGPICFIRYGFNVPSDKLIPEKMKDLQQTFAERRNA